MNLMFPQLPSHNHVISSASCPLIFSTVFLVNSFKFLVTSGNLFLSCLTSPLPSLNYSAKCCCPPAAAVSHFISSSLRSKPFGVFSHSLLSPCVRCCPPCLSSCCCPVCPSVWSPADRRVWAGCRTAWRTSSTPQCRLLAMLCRPGGSAPAASKS